VKDADDYLAHIKALIALNRQVVQWMIVREEAQGDLGLLRYRLTLQDGSLLEMFERFQLVEGRPEISKYSFHWQTANGELRKRWDNAAHHPEILTHPHHVHEGVEASVLPHNPTSAEEILASITSEVTG
jgi:hypothetical protein